MRLVRNAALVAGCIALAIGPMDRVAPSPAAAAPAALPEHPNLSCAPALVAADDDFMWHLKLSVTNPLDVPLITDSARVVIQDRSGNASNASPTTTQPLGRLLDALRTIEPGATREIPWAAPATVDSGLLTFQLGAHDSLGTLHRMAATATIQPGAYSKQHPSEFLTVDGKRVEVIFVAPPDSVRPAPGVLLVHGHAHYARGMLSGARRLHDAGYAVMILSQPGYGRSQGPPDFMGPHTIAAASAAMDHLARSPGVNSTRLGAWGFSRGATVVALLMTRRGDVGAGIAQGGIYDLWAEYRGTAFDGIRSNIRNEVGTDSSAWRRRSAAHSAKELRGKLLILHGEDDRNVPVGQAKGFYEQLRALGAPVEAQFFPGAQHALPRDQASARAMEFLNAALKR